MLLCFSTKQVFLVLRHAGRPPVGGGGVGSVAGLPGFPAGGLGLCFRSKHRKFLGNASGGSIEGLWFPKEVPRPMPFTYVLL